MYRSLALTTAALSALTLFSFTQAQNPVESLNRSLEVAVAPDGSIDIGRLQDAVMSQIPSQMDIPWQRLDPVPAVDQDARLLRTWGLRVEAVPQAMSAQHEVLVDDAGLLVTHVQPDSVAHRAGLKVGMVVVKADRRLVRRAADLPLLTEPCDLVVLTDEGLRLATVEPVLRLPVAPMFPGLPGSVSSQSSSSSSAAGGESVSVSNVNGQIHIDATLMTVDGPQRVELRGSREEVDAHIKELPADLAGQLRSRVDY